LDVTEKKRKLFLSAVEEKRRELEAIEVEILRMKKRSLKEECEKFREHISRRREFEKELALEVKSVEEEREVLYRDMIGKADCENVREIVEGQIEFFKKRDELARIIGELDRSAAEKKTILAFFEDKYWNELKFWEDFLEVKNSLILWSNEVGEYCENDSRVKGIVERIQIGLIRAEKVYREATMISERLMEVLVSRGEEEREENLLCELVKSESEEMHEEWIDLNKICSLQSEIKHFQTLISSVNCGLAIRPPLPPLMD
jgi:hypothetical protein